MRVRFWTYHNDADVRLTLTNGQTIALVRGGPTDEGYSHESVRFTLEGDTVVQEYDSDARDCDGRFSTSGTAECRIDRLDAHQYNGQGYPKWERVDASQRDYSAEAMGY